MKKSIIALWLSIILLFSASFVLPVSASTEQTDADVPTNYQQTDPRWGTKHDIGPSGCGLISLVNAVHYLNGTFIDPIELAIYAHEEIDAYNGSLGGGTARWVLYSNIKNFEEKYGFKVVNRGASANVKDKRLINHLTNGGTAVAHVYGHFIAICGYDPSDKTYLVYDCAANVQRRGTTKYGDRMTAKELTGQLEYTNVDWWCLLESTCTSQNTASPNKMLYFNREAKGYIRVKKGDYKNIRLSGTAQSSRGIKSLYYTVNYDLSKQYPLVPESEIGDGNSTVKYDKSVDLTGRILTKKGEQIIRVSANTLDGGVCDVAEFVVSSHDGNTFTDEYGNLTLDMSGFLGNDDVVLKLSTLGTSNAAYKMGTGSILNIGYFDLSQYERAIIRYSVKNVYEADKYGFDTVIGFNSRRASFGTGKSKADLDSAIAYASMENGDEGSYKTVKEAVVDLSQVDYAGFLYLTSNTYMISPVREIVFIKNGYTEETTPTESATTAAETVTDVVTNIEGNVTEEADATSIAEQTETGEVPVEPSGCNATAAMICMAAIPCMIFVYKRKNKNE